MRVIICVRAKPKTRCAQSLVIRIRCHRAEHPAPDFTFIENVLPELLIALFLGVARRRVTLVMLIARALE